MAGDAAGWLRGSIENKKPLNMKGSLYMILFDLLTR
jgi:hypothetical protein